MEESEIKLQILDIYFSKYSFSMTREDNNREFNTTFKVEYATNSVDDSKYRISVDTSITNSTNSVSLTLQAIAIFRIEKGNAEEAFCNQIIKQNTVAIMFPFIRSQISLLTTQPGMMPIILQPINIASLLSTSTEDVK